MGLNVNSAGYAHDRAGIGVLLWGIGSQEERTGNDDAIVLRIMPFEHTMDTVGLQPFLRP